MSMITTAVTKQLTFNPFDPIGSILDRAMDDVEKTLNQATQRVHDASVDLLIKAAEQAAKTIARLVMIGDLMAV